MATKIQSVAFRPHPDVLRMMDERAAKDGISRYVLLYRAVAAYLDTEALPIRTPKPPKVKPPKAAKVKAEPKAPKPKKAAAPKRHVAAVLDEATPPAPKAKPARRVEDWLS